MLTLTEQASTVVKDLAERATGSAESGLRISTAAADSTDYDVKLAASPEPDDQVVDNLGAHVFLEQVASAALSDKMLDATIDENGAVRFLLSQQA